MLNAELIETARKTSMAVMTAYDDSRALRGASDPQYVESHFTHRQCRPEQKAEFAQWVKQVTELMEQVYTLPKEQAQGIAK